jgi:D-alanyl-D-alanine carboxypeptidase/D-alanyl-D-alanine-endopeptidase (penicillin-binding protein 4)
LAPPSTPAAAPEGAALQATATSTPETTRATPDAQHWRHEFAAAARLAGELREIFAAPTLQTSIVSALVQSLDSGEVLYSANPDMLVVPASNMKIVTMAVGATRLGWDFRFETRLESLAQPVAGVLAGDLFVVGGGDPTINARSGDRLSLFRDWAARLKAAGVKRVAGRLVGDDDRFDEERFGQGWSWDDLAYGYAAPVGALQFNENVVEVVIRPGRKAGDAATVLLRPATSDLVIGEAQVTTSQAGSRNAVTFRRVPGRRDLQVSGTIAVDSGEDVQRAAVDNPTLYFVASLRDVLGAEGIVVQGEAVDIDVAPDSAALKAAAGGRGVLLRHTSPRLADLAPTVMKVSQNLYAETVFRALSLTPGPASADASRELAIETLRQWGLAPGQYSIADGSGLSRLNYVSATALVRILRAMARDASSRAAFETTLPIAGRDGTLTGRMRATRAEANATAKTGTLTSVRALSGYVRTLDGERLVFSFTVNNFLLPSSAVDAVVDLAVERLANFRR